MTDIIAALRTVLLNSSDVVALVGTRVFAMELPKAEAVSMPRAAVVLVYSGGFATTSMSPVVNPRVDIYSYGETFHGAGEVDRAVYGALKALSRYTSGDTLIHSVSLAGGPMPLRDGDAGWPVQMRSVTVMADERQTG